MEMNAVCQERNRKQLTRQNQSQIPLKLIATKQALGGDHPDSGFIEKRSERKKTIRRTRKVKPGVRKAKGRTVESMKRNDVIKEILIC